MKKFDEINNVIEFLRNSYGKCSIMSFISNPDVKISVKTRFNPDKKDFSITNITFTAENPHSILTIDWSEQESEYLMQLGRAPYTSFDFGKVSLG